MNLDRVGGWVAGRGDEADRGSLRAARVPIAVIAMAWIAGSACLPPPRADANRDGVIDEADALLVESCLGAALPGACAGADVDRNAVVDERDLAQVVERMEPPVFPALVASDPVDGGASVPRTAWLRLDFGWTFAPGAADSLALACDGVEHAVEATSLGRTRVVVNPSGDLPAGRDCVLSWDVRGGRASIDFRVAGAGAPATVYYDRRDPAQLPPFPDDYWLASDPGTATGHRVAIDPPAVEPDAVQLFDALLGDTAQLDGFSPLAMIAVELSAAPDTRTLPMTPAASLDPLSSVALIDLTPENAGHRVPFQLHVRQDTLPGQLTAHSLVAFPSIPLTPGGRYAFVVTRRALASATRPFEASEFFAAAKAPAAAGEDPATTAVREVIAPALDALATLTVPAIPADDIALAVRISVRSTADLPRDYLAMKAQVLAEPAPPVTLTSVTTNPNGNTTVRGTWQAPNWRQSIFLARDAAGLPRIVRRTAVPFVASLPPAARTRAVPVVMYQHGSPGNAIEMLTTADHLTAAGFAVVGFDDALTRAYADPAQLMAGIFGGLLFGGHVPDYWAQTYGEQMAFLRALETLAGMDLLPAGAPDGVRELDLSQPLGYFGLSYGGNHGQAFLPYAPEIRAAALVAGGTRLGELLFWQDERDPLGTGGVLALVASQFPSVRAPDVWVGLSIFQMIFDAQDPHNQAAFLYANPREVAGTTRKPSLLVVEGIDDSFTTNNSTRSLAWTAGPIPHVSPVIEPIPFLETETGVLRANVDAETTAGLVQYMPAGRPGIPPSLECARSGEGEGHYCAQLASEPQQTAFFLSALDGPPAIVAADFDTDGDRLGDLDEPRYGTNPDDPDTDDDGLLDGVELIATLNPLDPTDATRDFDGDGLTNAAEIALGTNVRSRDTDADGLNDPVEPTLGTNPLRADTDGGGRKDGAEANTDHTDPLDASDDLPFVALPREMVDGAGYSWTVNPSGSVSFGVGDSFGSGGGVTLFAFTPNFSEVFTEDERREMVLGPLGSTPVRVWRKVYVSEEAGFVRFLEIVENRDGVSRSGTVRMQSNCDEQYLATSSGDAVLTPADDYVVCDDGEEVWSADVVAYAQSGPGALVEPSLAQTEGSASSRRIRHNFSLVVPPQSTMIVMHFAALRETRSEAVDAAAALTQLAPEQLVGMSAAERAAVVNFVVP